MIATEMPSGGRISLLHQPEQNRYVAHLLYGPPVKRGACLLIEDLVPLYHVPLELRVPQHITRVFLVPDKTELTLARANGTVKVTVPKVQCHQAVVFEYE
jgi:hypothetical protein